VAVVVRNLTGDKSSHRGGDAKNQSKTREARCGVCLWGFVMKRGAETEGQTGEEKWTVKRGGVL